MKKFLLIFVAVMISTLSIYAQSSTFKSILPSITVNTLEGKPIKASEFSNDGKPFVICFWATWCKPCLMELNTMAELYEEWQTETGIKIYAVSIDDARTCPKVKPLVSGSDWDYEVMLDQNSELKRALGVNNPPHTFIVNEKGEIVWQHVGYAPGDEENLIEVYKKILNGEEVK
ncbi:MAG: TlpA disulfide reductase family protein [Bacteroidales bacterium]|jgi:alkyl hydroperoxide reductase subunit AhpC|nr:TlpA disulfide reductase family protein [Bacteroidales bacterium]